MILFPHRRRFFALALAKIIQPGATGPSLLFHIDFCDTRGVHRKNPLYALAIGDTPHRKRFVQAAAFTANHDAGENLNSFLVAFDYSRVYAYTVTDIEIARLGFLLLFFDQIDDAVHNNPAKRPGRKC
jgi:hypothetical protein